MLRPVGLDDYDRLPRRHARRHRCRPGPRAPGCLDLPASFASLPFDEQMLLVLDEERTARHFGRWRPSHRPSTVPLRRVRRSTDTRPGPRRLFARGGCSTRSPGFYNASTSTTSGLYDDGPGSGTAGCGRSGDQGCWADPHTSTIRSYTGGGGNWCGRRRRGPDRRHADLRQGRPVDGARPSPRRPGRPKVRATWSRLARSKGDPHCGPWRAPVG